MKVTLIASWVLSASLAYRRRTQAKSVFRGRVDASAKTIPVRAISWWGKRPYWQWRKRLSRQRAFSVTTWLLHLPQDKPQEETAEASNPLLCSLCANKAAMAASMTALSIYE